MFFIRTGSVALGGLNPFPTRRSSDLLGVSRNTIVTAYEELAADGLLLARAGTSTRVLADEPARASRRPSRSEEHTSELQSHSDLVCRLLLVKKNVFNLNNARYYPGPH